jgi:hypothetical protein
MRKHGEELVEFLRPRRARPDFARRLPAGFRHRRMAGWLHRPHPGPRQAGGRAAILSRSAVEVIVPFIHEADAMIARHAFASSKYLNFINIFQLLLNFTGQREE